MKLALALATFAILLLIEASAQAADSGSPFYGDPPDEHHPWAVHDPNRPQPKVVTPGTFSSQEQAGKPPSDAIILFDGKDLANWEGVEKGDAAKWAVKNGVMEVVPKTGDIQTRARFGDCQLHIEWAEEPGVQGSSQGRGNSGVFLMGLVEVQVLDSYHNITYADGHAASVYGQNPPMANALRPPGEFQVYDIVFRRPVYREGKAVDPGHVTVFVNGVLAQDATPLEGPSGHMKRAVPEPFPDKGPLRLQDHGNPVRFRNIWYRELPPSSAEGGTDGRLSTETTTAKRKEIAAMVRHEGEQLKAVGQTMPALLHLMESLEYETEPGTVQQVKQITGAYVAGLKALPPDKLAGKKDEAKHLNNAFQFLAKFDRLPASFEPKVELQDLVKAQKWDKDK